ncbi:DeoR/GlpR family DNA-binding transcription regulator [Castellaniella caeni]|uniref:DeoR/GlpR family DNA-binding transcription regulator n=1 Tax=Castellaniella caeni TaxID=266123 RepID=UPI0008371021|nr:DeoR/GlpR family DNA-binding transcription regulator [Castellaniella caeni]
MSPNPRQIRLLTLIQTQGSCSLDELAEHLQVTVQTVRRDVQRLAEANLLVRFHGGARLPASTIENIAYRQRAQLHAQAKQRIAQAIARQIPNDCSLMINIGTTTEAIARALGGHTGLRIITNNINVACMLGRQPGCEVILAGGNVRPRDLAIVGEATVELIRQFRVDIALMGISGIEEDGTLRDYDYREVKVSQAIMQSAREIWMAADTSKFGRPAMVRVGELGQIHRLFTDAPPPEPYPGLLQAADVDCVVVS